MEKVYNLVECLEKTSSIIETLINRHNGYTNTGFLLAYRGESKDYGKTKMMPSIFRNTNYIAHEKHLFELLKDYGFIEGYNSSNISHAIEAQHYVEVSRLLDITFSVLPAIYFACASNETDDGYLYVYCFPEYYSPNSTYIENFYNNIFKDDKKSLIYTNNFKVISHSYSNERIKAQQGGFIFFPGSNYKPISRIYYKKIIIDSSAKETILRELDQLFKVTKATLFPEKEKLKDIIVKKIDNKNYSKKDINICEEIDSCITRIDYELTMYNKEYKSKSNTQIEMLRIIRKEEYDLKCYINKFDKEQLSSEDKVKCINKINNQFELLKLKFGKE